MIDTSKNNNTEVLSFLALCDVRGVGFETLKKVARDRIGFSAFFDEDVESDVSQKILVNPTYARLKEHFSPTHMKNSSLDEARRKLDYMSRRRIKIVFPGDACYPRQLLGLRDVPRWLFVEGNEKALQAPAITAVGSRKVSAEGKWLATYFGFCLDELKAVTVSGLAEGIDQIVHRASLALGLPTVAVLGTGVLSDYPSGSAELRQRIVEGGGAVVTEYLPNDSVSAKNFVRRNRIQAALGRLVFPIEWSLKSGTAHTVKFATDLDRPLVFARAPTQPQQDWIPRELYSSAGYFTVPKDHDKFIAFFKANLEVQPKQKLLI
ncbi:MULTISPECIES: DNA-processing protein DprA [unclassified Ruegeria]|uniref:DNA-processing protein DprA n=1 Tax=Ruegeria TaxID=97050 RepID=UPI001489D95E|nr:MULTISPECIES: DNA-processing protein DprA [unclassified Ruegeria]NOD63734.1 DNA-processing protein DprA [Ruegeria sp. HKCCD6109]